LPCSSSCSYTYPSIHSLRTPLQLHQNLIEHFLWKNVIISKIILCGKEGILIVWQRLKNLHLQFLDIINFIYQIAWLY
jgi:hypothetical protein